tara:strand:- start:320 stop:454 length:135 start_codon:yes stop_codon:yes gene_type:complete
VGRKENNNVVRKGGIIATSYLEQISNNPTTLRVSMIAMDALLKH